MLKKIALILISLTLFTSSQVLGAGFNELQAQIEAKKQALSELENEEAKYNKELSKTKTEKRTLSNELNQIKREIGSVNYKIRVSEAQIEKLELELEKLGLETKSTEEKIELKKELLAISLRSLYEADRTDSTLAIVLTKNKLSDTILEIENLTGFSENVKLELKGLELLKEELGDKKDQTKEAQKQTEIEEKNLRNRKNIVSNLKEETNYLLTKTKNKEKEYQNLLSDIEKKRAEVSAEIDRLEESLQAQIDPNLLPRPLGGILAWPSNGVLTQGYGKTPDAIYFYNRGIYVRPFHNGIDLADSYGAPILAAEDGVVEATGNQDKYCYGAAYGRFVVVKHDNNLTSFYAHLSSISVKKGDIVKRGDVIGGMGSTGASTGSHLHFTVYFTPTFRMTNSRSCGPMPVGGPVNPLDYLNKYD